MKYLHVRVAGMAVAVLGLASCGDEPNVVERGVNDSMGSSPDIADVSRLDEPMQIGTNGIVLEPLDASAEPKLSPAAALAALDDIDGSVRAHLESGGAVEVLLGSSRAGLVPADAKEPPFRVTYDFVLLDSVCLDPPPDQCDWHVLVDADSGEGIVSTEVPSE